MSLLTWYHYGIYNLNLLWQKEKVSDDSFSNKNLLREVIQKFQVFHLLFQVPFAWMPFNVGFTFGSISPVLKIFSLHFKKKKKRLGIHVVATEDLHYWQTLLQAGYPRNQT